MAETADELSAPLGQKTADKKRRLRLPFTMLQAVAALLGLFLATFAGFAIFNDNPLGGEPVVNVALPSATPEAKPAAPPSSASETAARSEPKQAASGAQKTITIIDGSSGARQNVTVSNEATADGGPDAPPPAMTGIDQRLLEKSRYGMIPVVADGLKPFTAYAANADRAKAATMPVVAIVVGGLGVGAAKTLDAIMKLPPAVTLAFTPYGSDPSKRSVAATLAGAQAMPFAKADINIDQVPTPMQIDQALASLQDLAKEHGTAIGVASALPVSIERIGAWVKTLDSHGIMLVPLTTAMLKSKSS
jgi:hypothetical protein